MIVSFADKTTQDIWDGTNSKEARKIPKQLWPLTQRKLDMLNAAAAPDDLRAPPSNSLKKLGGDLKGYWSIRVNDQYRVVFRWEGAGAHDVQVTDYH